MAPSPLSLLRARVADAAASAFGPDVALPEPLVVPTSDPRHGDYTCPLAMALAGPLGQAPRGLAERLAADLDLDAVCEPPDVAGPGFVNLRLKPSWLAERVSVAVTDPRAGLPQAAKPQHVVVDYSGPNVAKAMHVGHLRSTILGDCLANVLEFAGHSVERVNHLGDWGTQFGMLIAQLEDEAEEGAGGAAVDLETRYRRANARFTEDPVFRERARRRVVDLQSGEESATRAWEALVDTSRVANREVYELLGVRGLIDRGESSYASMLPQVVADLEVAGLVVVDDGAKCVFVEGFTNKEGEPLPLIVQKADGGYNYATTDLAALRQRVSQGAERILYLTGAEQAQHFQMVFAVARRAGWLPEGVEATHVPFGLVLGEGGQRLRTRSGATVQLRELLEEAVSRAAEFVTERAAERGTAVPGDVVQVARVVGIGAVKYADLSQNRQSNYVFAYDRMLSLKGNTAPYLQYAYARIRSILRESSAPPVAGALVLAEAAELDLARRVVTTGDVLDRVADDYLPSHLCAHLYELAQAFHQFYERCPVLRAEEAVRTSRLALCAVTAERLRQGLALLGIGVLERI